jgi:SAM-dependent methyltransferase
MRYSVTVRSKSYGQEESLSLLDRFGQVLSNHHITKVGKLLKNKGILLDVGCGFNATLTKPIWKHFETIYLLDIDIDRNLAINSEKRMHLVLGELPEVLVDLKLKNANLIIANNILEHLDNPSELLMEFRKCRSIDSVILINVPSWWGKIFLELAAFKLGLAPKSEMDDHKYYFDKKSLWTLVRSAGFIPSEIKIKRTKFGLNVTCWIRSS